jgi:uncharacterized protein YbjT (DUF2867 family)
MAVSAGVARIEQLHGPKVYLAAFQGKGHQLIKTQILAGQLTHGFMDVGIDRIVFLAEDRGMVGVGGKAAQAVHGDLL